MKVRCKLCANEKNGYCTKKTQATKPVKIRLNKPRSCDLYDEDSFRVFSDYQKREQHKKKLEVMARHNSLIAQKIKQVQDDLASRKQEQEGGQDDLQGV